MATTAATTATDLDQGQPRGIPNRMWQIGKFVEDCLIEMFDKGLWTDITFLCSKEKGDDDSKVRISAHKILLAARSPVFEAMFFGPCADGCSEIKLEVDHLEAFSLFLRYLYCDTVELDEHSAPMVMELAHKYQVETLVNFCAYFLKKCVRVENACEILQLALFYEVNELRDHVCKVIDENAEAVFETEGFMACSVECLAYILKGNTLNVKEVTIFEKAIDWARGRCHGIPAEKINGQKIRKVLKHAFDFIRAPIMTLSEFVSCYGRKGYLSIEEYEDILEHISGNASIEDVCNRSMRRSPLSEIVPVRNFSNLQEDPGIQSNKIMSILKIDVKEDVTIRSLKLEEFNACTANGYDLYHASRELDLSVKITCTELNYNARCTPRNTGDAIFLSKPLWLQKANSPYQVCISAQFKSKQTLICPNIQQIYSKQKSNSGLISVTSDGGEEVLVTEIKFCRNSGRND